MSNDSTTTGYLTPTGNAPLYDEPLERELSRWVRAITGLPAGMVRPRWTPEQAAQPAASVNWCGFGITGFEADAGPALVQGDENSELWRHEVVECMASFYGPGSQGIASIFRDGVSVPQNNHAMTDITALSLADCSGLTAFPELINNQWVRRYDVTVRLRRKVIRTYGIKPLAEAGQITIGE